MKIHVISTYHERITGSGRCSDGWYRSSEYTNSVKIFSDTENINVTTSEIIYEFINSHTEKGHDKVWDCSYEGSSTEESNLNMTSKLSLLLEKEQAIACEIIDECPFLLNQIAIKTVESHNLAIANLKKRSAIIHANYLEELEICKAIIAKEAFYSSENAYSLNQLMPVFDAYPLDIARISNDPEFLEYLLLRGATKVEDSYKFAEWLCKIGKFEYLINFVDLTKLQLIRADSSVSNNQLNNYRLTECILYNSIIQNKLDVFYKYGRDLFKKEISEVNFNEINQKYYIHNYKSVGILAVEFSNIETVKELYGKCSFFENVKINFGYTISVLSKYCFRDYETAYFFLIKLPVDSIFAMFYWNKIDLLRSFIDSKEINFGEIPLVYFSNFFVQENNHIIEKLARVNSSSLINILKNNNHNFIPTSWCNDKELEKESVLEKCLSQKNFILLNSLFSICLTKEEIMSYDACRFLYKLYKCDATEDVNDLKEQTFKLIETTDLMKLLAVACIEINFKLIDYLTTQVDNINAPIDIEPTSFGLEAYKGRTNNIIKDYKNGTLIHLTLVANPNQSGRRLNIDVIKKLLDAGVDKSIRDESGKYAFDYITHCYNYKDNILEMRELVEMLYIEDIKICSSKGELISLFKNTKLPIVNKFESYLSSGINAVNAFKTDDKEVLSFFLSCGADIESLKEEVEWEKRKFELNYDNTNNGYYDDESYTDQDLRDMYRDAFDGFSDAEWNID